ncbi:MAG: hypothetical protein WKF30_03595 [Pyrinomonadaceae bacterium]
MLIACIRYIICQSSWRRRGAAWRWARTHLYALIIPLRSLGMTYFSFTRWIESAPDVRLTPVAGLFAACLAAFCLALASLSRAAREIYHLRQPESLFDRLPVEPRTLLHATLAVRFARTCVVGAAILVFRPLIDAGPLSKAIIFVALVALLALTALVQVFAALNWIHWSHMRDARAALAGAIASLVGVAINALLLVIIFKNSLLPAGSDRRILMIAAVWAFTLYPLIRLCYLRWRAADLEHAQRLGVRRRRRSLFGALAAVRFVSASVRAQLTRDLRLTLGIFSSAVFVAGGLALLWMAMLVAVLLSDTLPSAAPATDWFETTWQPPLLAVKIGSVCIIASLIALLPVLVAHQIPRLWLERAIGIPGAELWEAKLWYARMISLPAPALAWLAGVFLGQVPAYYALPLLAECLWVWWIVSTLVGSLAYEMPDQPGLALIVMLTLGVGVGIFVAALWPIGLAFTPSECSRSRCAGITAPLIIC